MRPQLRSVLSALNRHLGRTGFALARHPNPNELDGHLEQVLESYSVECVVDVGANEGQFGRRLRQRCGYRGRIVSFEPAVAPYAKLAQLTSSDPLWEVHNLGASDEEAARTLLSFSDSQFNSLNAPSRYGEDRFGALSSGSNERIQTVRLDSLLDQLVAPGAPLPIFLKSDTQGHDLSVLAGASELLERCVGVQVEVAVKHIYDEMTDWTETLAVLKGLGFELSGLFPVSRDSGGLRLVELDCIMCRPEGWTAPPIGR